MKLFTLGLSLAPLVAAQNGFGGFTGVQFETHEENTVEEVDIDAEFEGEFEDFDLDSIIRQSDSPLLQELLGVDNVYNADGTVALEGKGWFDSEQADASPESLEKYLFYGCYCFPDGHNKLFTGFGDPIDEVDKACRKFQTCYRCVGVDYGQEECINTSGYKFSGVIDPVTGKKDIVCKNKRQNCGASQCQCDRQLAFQLAEAEIAWNPNNQGNKYGLFDRQASCNVRERSATVNHDIETKCCGFYPERTPYAHNGPNGERNCCGSKTYDPRILECCPGNILQSLGTCIF